MGGRFFLLCSVVVFSVGSTKAAQEGEYEREITIYNNLSKAVRIYSDSLPHKDGRFYSIKGTNKQVLLEGTKAQFLIDDNKFYYSPLQPLIVSKHNTIEEVSGVNYTVLARQEKEITVSPDESEITLEK